MGTEYTCNVVVDLEFTLIPKGQRKDGLVSEIIEIGAVKLSPKREVIGVFSQIVKPTLAKGVSGAVHRMTGIGDEDLTSARPLEVVLSAFVEWIGEGRVRMVTWSDTDLRQITKECAIKGIDVALPGRWMDIQRVYPRLMGMSDRRKVALGEAADWCGIGNDKASAHRALYDAQMTAELFRMMAAGECAEHRTRLAAEMEKPKEECCAASIASRCGGLADLLASLKAQECAA